MSRLASTRLASTRLAFGAGLWLGLSMIVVADDVSADPTSAVARSHFTADGRAPFSLRSGIATLTQLFDVRLPWSPREAFSRKQPSHALKLKEKNMSQSAPSDIGPPVARRNPSTLLDATGIGLSQISVVQAGRLAFLSGKTATPRDRGALPSDLAGQGRVVADNLAAALKDLGASPRDVVLLRVFVVDATTDRFLEAWSPIRDMLGGELPSMTGIGVQALWTPELQLEVEMVVRVP